MHTTHHEPSVQKAPAVLRGRGLFTDAVAVWVTGNLSIEDDAAPRFLFKLLKLSEYFKPTCQNQRIKGVCNNPRLQSRKADTQHTEEAGRTSIDLYNPRFITSWSSFEKANVRIAFILSPIWPQSLDLPYTGTRRNLVHAHGLGCRVYFGALTIRIGFGGKLYYNDTGPYSRFLLYSRWFGLGFGFQNLRVQGLGGWGQRLGFRPHPQRIGGLRDSYEGLDIFLK